MNAQEITHLALTEVTSRYGDGSATAVTMRPLRYHNLTHSQTVRADALRLAHILKLDEPARDIVEMAAAAHDIVHGPGEGAAERASAHWLVDRMDEAGFDAYAQHAAHLAIIGTTPVYDNQKDMLGQQMTRQSYPDERARRIAACVAAADLSKLYAPDGPLLSRQLYLEREAYPSEKFINRNSWLDFQWRSEYLLENYEYPLTEAEILFGALRDDVIEYQRTITRAVINNEITTWQQLLASDKEFQDIHLDSVY